MGAVNYGHRNETFEEETKYSKKRPRQEDTVRTKVGVTPVNRNKKFGHVVYHQTV